MNLKGLRAIAAGALTLAISTIASHAAARPVEIGKIVVCYACGAPLPVNDPQFSALLAANPSLASDGLAFEFVNTSPYAIAGGVISVKNPVVQTYFPAYDQFMMPTIVANGKTFLVPSAMDDGQIHPDNGLFAYNNYGSPVADLSDSYGGIESNSVFSFTGSVNGSGAVWLQTAGASTAIPHTFTPTDPGLVIAPYSELSGYAPYTMDFTYEDGLYWVNHSDPDNQCDGCYYGTVATLWADLPVPEPSSWAILVVGLAGLGGALRYRKISGRFEA